MEINQQRLALIDKICDKYSEEQQYENIVADRYLFLKKKKILGCSIQKVASSSFAKTFKELRLELDKSKDHGKNIRIKIKKSDLQHDVGLYKKFVFVREPMERLASAYYDKMVTNDAGWLRGYRKKVSKMAAQIKGDQRSSHEVSFDDFLLALVINGQESGEYQNVRFWSQAKFKFLILYRH